MKADVCREDSLEKTMNRLLTHKDSRISETSIDWSGGSQGRMSVWLEAGVKLDCKSQDWGFERVGKTARGRRLK